MNIKNIRIFSQNVCKKKLLTNTILEVQKDFNIIFIQELPWSIICAISSLSSKEEEHLVRVLNHPN